VKKQVVVGACGLFLDAPCIPDFEDDLCAVCQFNGRFEISDETDEEEDDTEEENPAAEAGSKRTQGTQDTQGEGEKYKRGKTP